MSRLYATPNPLLLNKIRLNQRREGYVASLCHTKSFTFNERCSNQVYKLFLVVKNCVNSDKVAVSVRFLGGKFAPKLYTLC